MVRDGIGMKIENLGDKAVFGTFMMHPNDQKFGLVFLGGGWVVEGFGDISLFLVSELQSNHCGDQ